MRQDPGTDSCTVPQARLWLSGEFNQELGGGVRGQTKSLCTEKRPPISGPFDKYHFFLRNNFLMSGRGAQAAIPPRPPPPPPPPPSAVTVDRGLPPGSEGCRQACLGTSSITPFSVGRMCGAAALALQEGGPLSGEIFVAAHASSPQCQTVRTETSPH